MEPPSVLGEARGGKVQPAGLFLRDIPPTDMIRRTSRPAGPAQSASSKIHDVAARSIGFDGCFRHNIPSDEPMPTGGCLGEEFPAEYPDFLVPAAEQDCIDQGRRAERHAPVTVARPGPKNAFHHAGLAQGLPEIPCRFDCRWPSLRLAVNTWRRSQVAR